MRAGCRGVCPMISGLPLSTQQGLNTACLSSLAGSVDGTSQSQIWALPPKADGSLPGSPRFGRP